MSPRSLGRNGPQVHPIGIGAMSFSNFYGPAIEEQSHAVLSAAIDHGVNHLDTANIYGMGQSEEAIGSFLKKQGARAQDFFTIASKGGIDRTSDERPFNNTRDYLKAELDQSLRRLGVEAIDLYYIHRRDPDVPLAETVGTLTEMMTAGKIKSFGFSEIAPTTINEIARLAPVAAVQSEYSLSTRGPELGVVQATKKLGAAMVAFSPVGRGLLTDKPHTADVIKDMPFLAVNPRFIDPCLSANIKATKAFRELAADLGMAASTLAVAWLLHQDDHILPIPGTRSVTHFKELIAAAEVKLTADDMAAINAILPPGWAHGDRYSAGQWNGVERYC
ncbi:MAG: aldo/keto reductase [Alphaproteobacteria bacterium]|nr:aldo/keto reductase [Alphaproteobacteria bacterium]